jgi:hypothetical protein
VIGARIAAALALVLAGAAVAALLLDWPAPSNRPTACAALDELSAALTRDTLGDQAAVRARAAALADLLDDPSAAPGPAAGTPAPAPARDVRISEAIRDLLDDPAATVEQLVAVLVPIADACEVPLAPAGRPG